MRLTQILARGVAGIFLIIQGCALPMPTGPVGQAPAAPATDPLGGPVTGQLPGVPNPGPNVAQVPQAPSTTPGATAPGASTPGSFPELDAWPGGQLPPAEFFRMIAPAVIASSRETGVPAAVTMAQAALETGYGRSSIGDAKNLFGIKGEGPAGSVSSPTTENFGNGNVRITDRFRKYNNWVESIKDHDNLLATKSRYAGAMAVRNDPEAFARAIHRAGYATDPEYSNKLIRIMRDNNLMQLAQQA